jgi:hypothetical protein
MFLLLNSCTLISELAPVHEDTSHVRKWLVIPVFYATTRERAPLKAIDYLESKSETGLRFGVKNTVVPAPDLTAVTPETIKAMGWKLIDLDSALPDGKTPPLPAGSDFSVPDREFADAEVVSNFDAYRKKSGSKKVVVFVHGCCATFQTSLARAARIAAHMQIPLIVYDWASPRGFSKYLENETLVEQTEDDFYDFLSAVEGVVTAPETILIGHSMGVRFLDNALVRRHERTRCGVLLPRFREIVLCQPDIDARAYIEHNDPVASQSEKIRIYANADDGRLDASAVAHGGFERLGRPGKLRGELCKIKNQDLVDVTQCKTGHEIPFWLVADLSRGADTKQAGFICRQSGSHYIIVEKI